MTESDSAPSKNQWERAEAEWKDWAETAGRPKSKEGRVAEGALDFQELGFPVAIVAGIVWAVRWLIRKLRGRI